MIESLTFTPSASQVISFKQFAALARRRSWSAQHLAGRFRGQIQEPLEFFSRVLSDQFTENLIPYRSVIDFYNQAESTEVGAGRPVCACGCGRVVFDRKKWATPSCRQKAWRQSRPKPYVHRVASG